MQYLILFIGTLLCCLIFDLSKALQTFSNLRASYVRQFKLMTNRQLSDEDKQKLMMQEIGVQVKYLFISVIKVILVISPFILYILADSILEIGYEQFYSIPGIGLSVVAVVGYLLLKKFYVRLFKS